MKILHIFTIAGTAESFFDGQFGYLGESGFDLHLICSDSPANGFLQRNKLTFQSVAIMRKISPWADLKAIVAVCKYIRSNKIDTVVGHTPKGALVAMAAAFIMGVPRRVYYRHGLIYTTAKGIKRFILKKEEQIVSMLSTRIVNVSPSLSALAVEDRLNKASKQQIIGSGTCGGIDALHKFNPDSLDSSLLNDYRQRAKITEGDFVVGFCGRLCRDKGTAELVKGFDLFVERNPDCRVKLLLVGDFDGRDTLPTGIKEKIEGSADIILTGHIKKEIEYYYNLMDVFVFPSYREGFGMSVIEASAMKKPILVSRSHGCVDSIRENITGYYIDITPEGICSGIERVFHSGGCKELGVGGRQFVLDNFDHSVMWPEVLEFYKSL